MENEKEKLEKTANSVEDVLNLPGNDELKFGVLIGLVKVEQATNKEVVDAVLNLLVGGAFELESNFIIKDDDNILHMVELLQSCSETLQAEIWSHFTAIVRKSQRNVQACMQVNLVSEILDKLNDDTINDVIAQLLLDILSVLATYSITVPQLRKLFSLLQVNPETKRWPRYSVPLLNVLRQMPKRQGPDEFFSFTGNNKACIALPPISKWPYQNGWTFHCWLRLDPVTGMTIERERPYVYSFRTAKGLGYSAHFLGSALVVTSMKIKGKGFQHCVKYEFQPRKWYMISIVHVYNRWSKSEIRAYVNGESVSTTEMSWLVNVNEPFDKCFIGGTPELSAETMFCGQMSSVYLFNEALSWQQIYAIRLLGAGYKSQFRLENEIGGGRCGSVSGILDENSKRILYDGRLANTIGFMYTPISCDSQLCLESSPKANNQQQLLQQGFFVHSPHALMMEDVKAIVTHSIYKTLHSIGGIQILFPLFSQLDKLQRHTGVVNFTVCSTLMGLLCDLLRGSVSIQQQFVQNKGFLVISYLLEKCQREHLTLDVLNSFLNLTKYLVSQTTTATNLLRHLFDHILFNPALWIYSAYDVQLQLYSYLSTEFIRDAHIYSNLRRISACLQSLHSLKYYYWVVHPYDKSGIRARGGGGGGGIRPTNNEMRILRAYIILYVKRLVLGGSGVQEDELQAILNYLSTIHEDDNIQDVLQLTVSLMAQHPSSMVPAFDKKHGIKVVYKLLASPNEAIRLQALKLLGYFLMRSTHKRKHDAMNPHNLINLLTDRLLLNSDRLSTATYNVLFELLTEKMTSKILTCNHANIEPNWRVENSLILKVIASLIRQSQQTDSIMNVKKTFLLDLTALCMDSKENRRTILQMSVWQDWLFSLAYIYPRTTVEEEITKLVMELFRMLLHHAIKFEYGGWRVWIDTLAIIHSKVSYEDFKMQMNQMYNDYERQKVDNVSDPTIRNQMAISTISGIRDKNHQQTTITEIPSTNESSCQYDDDKKTIKQEEEEDEHDENKLDKATISDNELDDDDDNKKNNNDDDSSSGGDEEIGSRRQDDNTEEEEKEDEEDDDEEKVDDDDDNKRNSRDKKNMSFSEPNAYEILGFDPTVVSFMQDLNKIHQEKLELALEAAEKINNQRPSAQSIESNYEQISAEKETAITNKKDFGTTDDSSSSSSNNNCDNANNGRLRDSIERPTELKSNNNFNSSTETKETSTKTQQQQQPQSTKQKIFSPGPRAPPFRIPEFRWSYLHQELLHTVIFSLEKDVASWKSHQSKNVIDFVNSSENHMFVVNVTHVISQLADTLISSCGGLLPLLAAATSPSGEIELLEPTQGLSVDKAASFLIRIVNLTDILIFASSLTFSELESEKNMSSGGILRQCLRLVAACAVRNCLECRQLQKKKRRMSRKITDNVDDDDDDDDDIDNDNDNGGGGGGGATSSSSGAAAAAGSGSIDIISLLIKGAKNVCNVSATATNDKQDSVKDVEKLLQDMDINRLRAVVYRDVEETKQAQFLSLAIVYFCSVLMVSKYRDILEPPSTPATPNRPAAAGKKHSLGALTEGTNPRLTKESLGDSDASILSQITKAIRESQAEQNKQQVKKENIAVLDDINKDDDDNISNTSQTSREMIDDPKTTTTTTNSKENQADVSKDEIDNKAGGDNGTSSTIIDENIIKKSYKLDEENEDIQIEMKTIIQDIVEKIVSNDDEKSGQKKKENDNNDDDDDDEEEEEEKKIVEGDRRPEDKKTTGAAISSINLTTTDDGENSTNDDNRPETLHLTTIPSNVDQLSFTIKDSLSLTSRLETALDSVAPLLREIFIDFAPFLSKTLLGSHGQELLVGGLVTLKQSTSVVELVMLLCSQEWQNSLQKHAGLAFIELVNEGRLLSHATRDHIVRVANEAEFILNRMRADDVQKHAEFETLCAAVLVERRDEEKLCDHLISSARRRDHVIASKQKDKILTIMSNKHGCWLPETPGGRLDFFKLDSWEDDSRRRRRMVRNSIGSTHPEAALKAALEHGAAEDAINAARQAFHKHLALNKKTQQQSHDTTAEEDLSLMDERELDVEFGAGPVALSTKCKLLSLGMAIVGTISVTKTEMYFEIDDDEDSENKKNIDLKTLQYVDHLHGKWHFSEIRAIFARRYLHQQVGLEIFMASRTAVMFAFPDYQTVKKVIGVLPKVGVGVKYGLPQTRRVSSAQPKQLFKMSNMTTKWQRREISNFDYLMYLNTIAGRTYNDLNQYPVFPWVIVNYESDQLDLSLPSNYRDLSRPIGALNPTRKTFFQQRFSSWEHEHIPPFHYGTHYSTSAFTLNWLIRLEPFTSAFLSLQGGKFDHANRTFHSIATAWKNCQRDTSDVKELIPEFYYLPDMFRNTNNYQFGILDVTDDDDKRLDAHNDDDDKKVSDVELPPWASSPEDFVRKLRLALESEYVSCQLHQWIDLIFGYKQRGPEAKAATNVFYYLTYDGAVNLDSINDNVMRLALENQIQSFGQTPCQLLTEPHAPRSSPMHLSPLMFTSVVDDICMVMKFLSNSPIVHISANTHPAVPIPAVTTITASHNFAVNKWSNQLPSQQQQQQNTTSATSNTSSSSGGGSSSSNSGGANTAGGGENHHHHNNKGGGGGDNNNQPMLPLSMDPVIASCRDVMGTGLHRRSLGPNFDQRVAVESCHFVTTADNRYVIVCGLWDNSIRVLALENAKLCQAVFGHHGLVTCIARSECNITQDCYIVSGSRDCTVMLWHWSAKSHSILGDNNSIENPTPKAILTGHHSSITSVVVSAELGIVLSASQLGPVLVHSNSGELLRSLETPKDCNFGGGGGGAGSLLTLNREGIIAVSYNKGRVIATFSVNGRLQKIVTDFDQSISAICMSRDGQYLLIGTNSGSVQIWRTHDLNVLHTFPTPTVDAQVRSLALTHDQKFLLAGLTTGCLVVFNIDFNKFYFEYQDKYRPASAAAIATTKNKIER